MKRQPSVTEALAMIAFELDLPSAEAWSWKEHERRYDHDRHCVWGVTDDPRNCLNTPAFRSPHKWRVVVRGETL